MTYGLKTLEQFLTENEALVGGGSKADEIMGRAARCVFEGTDQFMAGRVPDIMQNDALIEAFYKQCSDKGNQM